MKESEHRACIDGLGLLEGEEVKLKYVCYREVQRTNIDGKPLKDTAKGLLVFTNDSMIFMQQQGMWSSSYTQALRIPLEHIAGISLKGFLGSNITILVGTAGASQTHVFGPWATCQESSNQSGDIKLTVEQIQDHLNTVRQERKRLAQEALAKGTSLLMVFCKYCGAKNKADEPKCVNRGAKLT